MKPRLALTLGDPKGIGPIVVAQALRASNVATAADWLSFGASQKKRLSAREAGLICWEALERAIVSIKTGRCDGIVTGPVSKTHLQLAGFPHPDQTSFLTERLGKGSTAMMMHSPRFSVVLTTIHLPLKKIFQPLTVDLVLEKIVLAHQSLRNDFRIRHPKIAVCGLNPHAGEAGAFGDEEAKILLPAIQKAKKKHITVSGPHPADTVFWLARNGQFDCVLAHYHDQGLIPIKTLDFHRTVNVTLGLSCIRTSPDHGPAFDLVGTKRINPSSMAHAMRLAIRLCQNRTRLVKETESPQISSGDSVFLFSASRGRV